MKVYVLVVGEYSDAYVHSVYSTEEAALLAVESVSPIGPKRRENANVQEYELDTTEYPSAVTYYVAESSGAPWDPQAEKRCALRADDIPAAGFEIIPVGNGYIGARFHVVGVGRTAEAALKSHQDQRAHGLAVINGVAD